MSDTPRLLLTAAAAAATGAGVTAAAMSQYLQAVKIPKLVCGQDAEELQQLLLDEAGAALREPYRPHLLHWHWTLSSLLACVRAVPLPPSWRRGSEERLLVLSDGGTVGLDWWGAAPSPGAGASDRRPVALVLPGMANSSLSWYIRRCMERCTRAGFRAVALNYRGVEHMPITSPRLGAADSWRDLPEVLAAIRAAVGASPRVVAIGFSMGGTILAKYLGELGPDAGVDAAVAVSPPLAYPAHEQELERRWLLSAVMAVPLKLWLLQKRAQLAVHLPEVTMSKVLRATSLLELAGTFTKANGYPDVSAYFRENDPEPSLKRIERPLLIIAATDDPLVFPIPRDEIRRNPKLLLAETDGGGHLGWAGTAAMNMGAIMAGPSWADSMAVRFLDFHLHRSRARTRVNASRL